MKTSLALTALGSAIGVLVLAGCSQPITGLTGLMTVHGHLLAMVETCDGVTADKVEVAPSEGQSFWIRKPAWTFEDADSAIVDLGVVNEFIDQLSDPSAALSTSVSSGVGGYVKFDVDDLVALEDGQIFTAMTDDSVLNPGSTILRYRTVDYDQFIAELRALCGTDAVDTP